LFAVDGPTGEGRLHTTGGHKESSVMSRNKAKTFAGLMKLITGTLTETTDYKTVYDDMDDKSGNDGSTSSTTSQLYSSPSLVDVARRVAKADGTKMDEKQYITYEVVCCSFLLGIVNEGHDKDSKLWSLLGRTFAEQRDELDMDRLIEQLKVHGAQEQLLMFLTGPAGAGKSTAMKVARRFCFEFCFSLGVIWSEWTIFFTAYTGSAAMAIGGYTICKSAFIFTKRALTEEDMRLWRDVRILVIDEISFMNDDEFHSLDRRLKQMRDRNKPFGGFSIVFAGDFRQLEPSGISENKLLFSRMSSQYWSNSINVVIILDNEHRFKSDPPFGKMMKDMWKNDLSAKDRRRLNTRVVGKNNLTLPSTFEGDAAYACPTNKERNAISAANFRRHVLDTHPNFDGPHSEQPPEHTIVIEADIRSKKTKMRHKKIDSVLRHRIITTCGDSSVKCGTKGIDPALCLYKGAYLICIVTNDHPRDKVPRGNGTLCRVVSMKLKDEATSRKCKNYYGKKVWTVCATDVEWIECEHVVKTEPMVQLEKEIEDLEKKIQTASDTIKTTIANQVKDIRIRLMGMCKTRRFKLTPQKYSVVVTMSPHNISTTKIKFGFSMTQFPINLNDGTTGHKLQGMSKDYLIITSWPSGGLFRNWEYTVLSRVRTLDGLFLFRPIDMDKSFAPSEELKAYIKHAKKQEKIFLNKRKKNMTAFYKKIKKQ